MATGVGLKAPLTCPRQNTPKTHLRDSNSYGEP